jgi:hypothetical protein
MEIRCYITDATQVETMDIYGIKDGYEIHVLGVKI